MSSMKQIRVSCASAGQMVDAGGSVWADESWEYICHFVLVTRTRLKSVE